MARHPARPIGRICTAALLVTFFIVAVWGADLLGGGEAPAPLVWPASGVGLALVLTCGLRVWPLIFISAVPAALLTLYEGSLTVAQLGGALLNAVAAALEPVLAACLIWRMVGEDYLARAGSFLLAMLVAAPLASAIAAIPLVLGYLVGGLVTTHSWVGLVATWHGIAIADWMGLLTLAPPLVLWLVRADLELDARGAAELLAFGSAAALVLVMPAPEQARYLLVAVHLAIAMRLPLKWAASAVAITSLVYLAQSTFVPRSPPPDQLIHLIFLREVVFAFILNVTTYVTALLHLEVDERRARAEGLARELNDAERRERQRIAQILHDHLQQILVAANMAIARFRQGDAAAGERAESLVSDAIGHARSLSVELHPPVLDTLGLTAAIQWLGEEAHERHGLEVEVETDDSPDVEAPEVASFVVQAVRELLLNTVKHAASDRACVRLWRTNNGLEVEVEDYGVGCEPNQLAETMPGHFGLATIRQRTELLGGRFDVSTRKGCRIRMRLPLARSTRRRLRWRRRLRKRR